MENEMSELKNKETKITQMKKIKRQKLYFNFFIMIFFSNTIYLIPKKNQNSNSKSLN